MRFGSAIWGVVMAAGLATTGHAATAGQWLTSSLANGAGSRADDVVQAGRSYSLSLGAGAVVAPRTPGSSTYEPILLPLVDFKYPVAGANAYIRGTEVGADYKLSDRFSVGAVGNYRFERSTNDEVALQGMRKIKHAVELGPKVRFQATPQWGVEAKLLQDVSNAHGGYSARAGTDYKMALRDDLTLITGAGVTYGSKDFNDAYYGVRQDEVRSGRPSHFVGSGFNTVDASVGVNYALNPCWTVHGVAGADFVVGDARKSPIVRDDVQPGMMVGASYNF